jgi:hypothetical protein
MRMTGLFAVFLALGVAGCGGGVPGLGGLGGGGSSAGADVPAQQGAGSTLRNLLVYGGTTVPQSQAPGFNEQQRDMNCPSVDILEGGSAYRGGGTAGGAQGVSYQASLINTARECSFSGNQVRIRVGVEGRLLLGTSGRAGSYSVPVRIVVKRRSEIVMQRNTRVSVTVPGNDTQAEFAHVEENIVLPLSSNDPGDEFDILVGFDGTVARPQRQARRR